ncbi:hypothetical protein L596_008824 [Steinernema carpocapsae]|uniref:Uncharacterized protein n=1 Tax=Steinernema carpocapsae TaxID=34508 RepID=A0A4U5PDL9_STECR|nr:hypothetical protein L596_008824 [Steinernema carpocapsae]
MKLILFSALFLVGAFAQPSPPPGWSPPPGCPPPPSEECRPPPPPAGCPGPPPPECRPPPPPPGVSPPPPPAEGATPPPPPRASHPLPAAPLLRAQNAVLRLRRPDVLLPRLRIAIRHLPEAPLLPPLLQLENKLKIVKSV